MKFNEDSRIKIHTILHLIRLGYTYLQLSEQTWDESNNIFREIFKESIKRINASLHLSDGNIKRIYDELSLSLENEDLGKAFYEKLIERERNERLGKAYHALSTAICL